MCHKCCDDQDIKHNRHALRETVSKLRKGLALRRRSSRKAVKVIAVDDRSDTVRPPVSDSVHIKIVRKHRKLAHRA
jgi:hypothetical protein